MEKFFTQILQNFGDFFNSLDMRRKVSFFGIGVAILGGMAILMVWASKTEYKLLYSDLTKEDAATISQLLEEGNISYQIDDDGKKIYVPIDQVNIWRLEIAKRGINFNSTLGYEVFDKQAFGTTTFVQKINRQRAIEGELMRTMKYLRGVKRARVHLNIPESSPFVSEKKDPSASVVLDLDPGMHLTKPEVEGLQHLVSATVEGMRNEHVVILDSKGKKLSNNDGDPIARQAATRIALESNMGKSLETRVEEILGRVVGEEGVIAKVSVKLDFTESVETHKQFDDESKAVVSEVNNSQKFEGVRPSPQGIPGARSNIPGENPQPGIPETRSDTNKNLSTKNYNVPSKVIQKKNPIADIEFLSVAVMVDAKKVPVLDAEGNKQFDDEGVMVTKNEAWSEGELDNFQAIVASAIGLNQKRGDSITIRNMEFAREDLSEAEAILRRRENREILKNITKYLMIGVLIALLFFIVVRPFIQWITENTVESIEDFLPKTIEELEKIQANQKLPGLEDALPTIEDKLNPEKIEGNMIKEKIINLVEQNPSKAAQVVHEMIHSQDGQKEIA
ncbi:flagellar basal-body MS-ring/collar protein FliF [Bacteriovoracaceae bacterium]|nr:flagellar basal-body MS-ring/collar protein FliF [Bacteriovoracaceae bacterium]